MMIMRKVIVVLAALTLQSSVSTVVATKAVATTRLQISPEVLDVIVGKPPPLSVPPPSRGNEHRQLQFSSPTVVNPQCNLESKDIDLGPSALLEELTDPSVYDKVKRPTISSHPSRDVSWYPDNVWTDVVVTDIVKLDELTQSMTISFYDVFKWNDVRLSYNSSNNGACVVPGIYPGTPTIDLSIEQFSDGPDKIIWTPSTIISGIQHEEAGTGIAFITEQGWVTTVKQKEIRIACDMHFGRYPFDDHTCAIGVSTLGQSPYDVTLIAGDPSDGIEGDDYLRNFLKNGDVIQVGEFEAQKATTGTSFGIFPGISGEIYFVRNGNYFFSSILMPDILLLISVYVGFWIDATNAQARVGLCVISGLSFRYLINAISLKLPAVTYHIWVVDYMLVSQFFAVFALVQYGLVQYFLSVESVRLTLLDGFKKSKISYLLRRRVVKPSKIFEQAELKYAEFKAAAIDAQASKIALSKPDLLDSSNSSTYSGSSLGIFGRGKDQKRHHKKNKVGTEVERKNMMLEMIKIEEAEETEEEEEQEENNNSDINHTTRLSQSILSSGLDVLKAVSGPRLKNPSHEDNVIMMNYPDSDPELVSDCDSECSSRPQSSEGEIRTVKVRSGGNKLNGKYMRSQSSSSTTKSASLSNSRRSSFRSVGGGSSYSSGSNTSKINTMLTTYEVMTIAYVKEAFEKFDLDHNGVLTIHELKMCFRAFGKYYTTNQVCVLMEAFRTSQGSSLAKRPTLHFVDFFCLLVELEQHEPLPEFETTDYLAIPPSLIIDMFMRLFFPVFVGIKILTFFLFLNKY